MSDRPDRLCLRWCAGGALTLGFLALFFYLTYRPILPRCYLIHLSVFPNTTTTTTTSADAIASFVIKIVNKNKELGLYHDDLLLSLFFNTSAGRSAAAVVPAFYQGHQKTASKAGNFTSAGGLRPPAAAAVRVGLESAVRYKTLAWKSRRHEVRVRAEVEVDGEGEFTARHGLRLRSGAPRVYRTVLHAVVFLILSRWIIF